MLIVSNTSPLSNLAIIGELSLLQSVYPKILIPSIVEAELMRLPEIQPIISNQIASGWLEVQVPTDLQLLQALSQSLDPGEAAAIALAIELNADRLLIDEKLGRRIASEYGLKIRGIVGVLVNAKTKGLVPAVQPILDRLIEQAGFRISQSLYDRILQESGE
ncbi:MAG: DUF3368 domain-containing protein [Leptolyngbya sp. UWPOB_LEPTO1]|uniref:DUF3368 domain-containing protein n=1 Tax=Leptolyngbya sp. UWPOB_LEPTO1 TaxID=2815653 RepID=UPI001AC9F7A0|nr:DUF3368 domain-containing protein [Leptolyngbya sp. UWPOB_LEPTO1]MBN8562550.1 DUF3368 domain-containing protein [Leptolyngbya sp. UWPOB_LEPTO1]